MYLWGYSAVIGKKGCELRHIQSSVAAAYCSGVDKCEPTARFSAAFCVAAAYYSGVDKCEPTACFLAASSVAAAYYSGADKCEQRLASRRVRRNSVQIL